MNVVVAIDSFKGSLDSLAAGEAAARGIRRAHPEASICVSPLADGGEGTAAALAQGMGGELRTVRVTGPLGKKVDAALAILPTRATAVFEMASASGITLVPRNELDPARASTFGTGELIAAALDAGCRRFLMGIGGSATNDGGAGMLQALGARFLDAQGLVLPPGGLALRNLARIDLSGLRSELKDCTFRVACDVTNPLCGTNGASAVFGPQKGATPEQVTALDAALARLAEVAGEKGNCPGDGAAGGLGFACRVFLKAELARGAEIVIEETHLAEKVQAADIVVTGEGRLDAQTAMGKAPIAVAQLAKRFGKRVIAFSGVVSDDAGVLNAAGIDAFFPILRQVVTLDAALENARAAANLSATAEQVFRLIG